MHDINEIMVMLARIETKLDEALRQGADHERRLRKLERVAWVGVGLALAGGGAAGTVAGLLSGG